MGGVVPSVQKDYASGISQWTGDPGMGGGTPATVTQKKYAHVQVVWPKKEEEMVSEKKKFELGVSEKKKRDPKYTQKDI